MSDRISYGKGNGKNSDPYRWGKTFRNVKPILQVTICKVYRMVEAAEEHELLTWNQMEARRNR